MSIEFYEEDNLATVVPRANALINRHRSKMVRVLMKAGFKTEHSATVFLVILSLCAIALAGLAFYRQSLPQMGNVTPLEDIPLNIRQTMTPEQIQYVKDHS